MNIGEIRNILRVNGVPENADEPAIREILSRARYSDTEISAALLLLKGSSVPAASAAQVPAPEQVVSVPQGMLVKTEKPRGFFGKFLPKKWMSLYGIGFVLFLYFAIAPIVGYVLMMALLFLGVIPGVGAIGLIGALFLFWAGQITGVGFVVDAYSFLGYHAIANALNATAKPYEITTVSCPGGYAMDVQGKHRYAVDRSYFDAAPIGYTMKSFLDGYVTFSHGSASEQIQVEPQNLDKNLTPPPIISKDSIYRFPIYLNGSDEYRYGSGIAQEDLDAAVPYIKLSSEVFTRDEFAAFKSCLASSQQDKGVTLRSQSQFLSKVAGIYFGDATVAVKPKTGRFECADGLTVETVSPNYLALKLDAGPGEPLFSVKIAAVEGGTVRMLTPDEINDASPSSYAMSIRSFTQYNNCLVSKKDCPPDARVKITDTSAQGFHWKTVTAAGDPYYYNWEMTYMRDYYAKELEPLGLGHGLPASLDTCKTATGQTVQEFFGS